MTPAQPRPRSQARQKPRRRSSERGFARDSAWPKARRAVSSRSGCADLSRGIDRVVPLGIDPVVPLGSYIIRHIYHCITNGADPEKVHRARRDQPRGSGAELGRQMIDRLRPGRRTALAPYRAPPSGYRFGREDRCFSFLSILSPFTRTIVNGVPRSPSRRATPPPRRAVCVFREEASPHPREWRPASDAGCRRSGRPSSSPRSRS